MIIPTLFALYYVGQLLIKTRLADRYARRIRSQQMANVAQEQVTIVQPILGGDPSLEHALESNLNTLPTVNFIWLVDIDDPLGIGVCEALAQKSPASLITIVRCGPPPQGVNPKAHKLAIALGSIGTETFVVLDDDTRLSTAGLHALLRGLADGATLATGLPRYHAAEGQFSRWLAEFVNSAAVLTYLPFLAVREPISIQGMCYAMRTSTARGLDIFRVIAHSLTDDHALAVEMRRRGLSIFQSIEPHDIGTSVSSLKTLWQILHRWFVFTRILLRECPLSLRIGIAAAYALPPLLLFGLFGFAFTSISGVVALAATLAARELILRQVKERYLGERTLRWPILSLLLELAQPALLISAYLGNTLRWRSRTIRVQSSSAFEYL